MGIEEYGHPRRRARRSASRRRWLPAPALAILLALLLVAGSQLPASAISTDDRELLEMELQRTDAILEHVAESVQQNDNPRLHDLFAQALKIQKTAHRIFSHSGENIDSKTKLQVLELTRRARDLGLRVQREVRQDVTYEELARRLLEQSRALLERIDEHDEDIVDRRVRAVLSKARDQLGAAERQFADGNFEVAFRLADSTHTLLRNLVQAARGRVGRQRLQEELQRTDQLLERAHQRLEGSGGDEKLKQADRLQEQARQAFAAERNEQALRMTLQVRRLVRQLLGADQGVATHQDVQRALERFDARLEKIRRHGDLTPPAEKLVGKALQARQRAVEKDAKGDWDRALEQLRVGLDLLNRAARMLAADSQ